MDSAAPERAIEERLKKKEMKERKPPLSGRDTGRHEYQNTNLNFLIKIF